ncbi:type II secretion system protein GspJ [Aliidiomarina halalkaliphila]|uniref:Type II secretion system protein J n=1 Tax=Aliidiomarina halalkaliphila TaxID=2593535 RepID=A0A552X5N2_9GAMM|nr:type II secretion system minor pseudopilin GspJ [Aliidiomarina halalkaliphila]TRW50310.1 type II secretion system protein GspJ [Aliidiomarina halalkaliphila]
MQNSPNRSQGFTFIEVLVAISIFAIIGLASATIFTQMNRSSEISEVRHQRLSELQFAFLMLDRDVRQMVIRPVRAVPEESRQYYVTNSRDLTDSDSGGLAFVRAGWSNPGMMLPRGELQPVVYRVRDNVLQRLHRPFVDDTSGDTAVQQLLTGVESLEVLFYHQADESDRWQTPHSLPDIVIVRITLEDFGTVERWLLTSGVKPEEIP